MPQILYFLRKDLRRCWPWVLVANLAMAISEIRNAQVNFRDDNYAALAVAVACGYLTALATQSESLALPSAYWLTRPFSRSGVFAGKALFLTVAILLPHFVYDCIGLSVYHVNLLASLPAILGAQFLFAAWFVAPAFALAVMTNGIARFTAAGLILAVVWAVVFGGFDFLDLLIIPPGWLGWTLRGIIVWTAAFTAAVIQYRTRRPAWAFAVIVAATLLTFPVWDLRAAEVLFAPRAVPPVTILAPDPLLRQAATTQTTALDLVVTNLPDWMALGADRIRLRVDSSNAHWTSGWMSIRAEIDSSAADILGGKFASFLPVTPQRNSGGGANHRYVLTLPYSKTSLLAGHGHLDIDLALTVFGSATDIAIPLSGIWVHAAGRGACIGSADQVACVWPLHRPEWLLNGEANPANPGGMAVYMPDDELLSPFPFDGTVWRRWLGPQRSAGSSTSPLTTREAAGSIVSEVSIPF